MWPQIVLIQGNLAVAILPLFCPWDMWYIRASYKVDYLMPDTIVRDLI